MNYLAKSNILPNIYTQNKCYNHYNKTQNITRMYFKNYCHTCHCHCHCHCHNLKNQLFQKIYCSRINNINPIDIYLEQKNKCNQPKRNRSAYNLIIPQNTDDSFEQLKKKYYPQYNENTEKENTLIPKNNYNLDKDDIKKYQTENNYSYKELKPNIKENINNNYNYDYKKIKLKKKDINDIYYSFNNNLNKLNYININNNNNNNINNLFLYRYEAKIKPVKSFQIKRKELSQYYHIVNPKKYSYGGEKLETVNSTTNHQYKEVKGTSNSKDGKNLPKSRVIYYNELNNIDDISNKDYLKSKLNNELYYKIKNQPSENYRYISYQNSPNNISRNIYSVKYESKTLKPQVINETSNTKFVESKNLQKTQSQKYLYNPKGDIIYRNNLNNNYIDNNISNGLKETIVKNNIYKSPNYNHNTTNITNNNSNINNIKSVKSYSVSNLNNFKEINSNKLNANINNDDYNNDFSQNNNQNNKDNKNNNITDYETIKQKVQLALLRKQQYEQERQKLFNNQKNPNYKEYIKDNKKYLEKFLSKGDQKPILTNDNNSLVSKTQKLLEKKKFKNMGKKDSNMANNDNKILFSLIKNLKEKNNDNNKNIIKPKLKAWKP